METLKQINFPEIKPKTYTNLVKTSEQFESRTKKNETTVNKYNLLKNDSEELEIEKNSLICKIEEVEKNINEKKYKIKMLEEKFKSLEIVKLRIEEYNSASEKLRKKALKIDQKIKTYANALDIKIKCIDNDVINSKEYCFVVTFEDKSASIIYNLVEGTYDCKNIKPKHPNFCEIKSFLQETNDISGFLTILRIWETK